MGYLPQERKRSVPFQPLPEHFRAIAQWQSSNKSVAALCPAGEEPVQGRWLMVIPIKEQVVGSTPTGPIAACAANRFQFVILGRKPVLASCPVLGRRVTVIWLITGSNPVRPTCMPGRLAWVTTSAERRHEDWNPRPGCDQCWPWLRPFAHPVFARHTFFPDGEQLAMLDCSPSIILSFLPKGGSNDPQDLQPV
jgi:hypothetical protein